MILLEKEKVWALDVSPQTNFNNLVLDPDLLATGRRRNYIGSKTESGKFVGFQVLNHLPG